VGEPEWDYDGLARWLMSPARGRSTELLELAELIKQSPREALFLMSYGVERTYIEALARLLALGGGSRG
jgi:hypothetical protein